MASILLIEGNPDNLELMAYLLQGIGHRALAAHDGRAGLRSPSTSGPT